jgi:hypothetical protein
VRDSPLAIKHGDRLSTLNDAKKLAQPGLKFSDPNLLHDYI